MIRKLLLPLLLFVTGGIYGQSAVKTSGGTAAIDVSAHIKTTQATLSPINYFVRIHGQSNAGGMDSISKLSPYYKRVFTNVYIWNDASNVYQLLQAGVNNNVSDVIHFGSEIAIASLFETYHPNNKLYISKYTAGSSAVAAVDVGYNWNAATVGSLLDASINDYDLPAMAAISGGYTDLGMIWVQGERDYVLGTATSNAYQANTLDTFSAFRTRESLSTMRIIVTGIRSSGSATDNGKTVRQAQSNFTGRICDPSVRPYNVYFDSGDRYDDLDGVHWKQLPFGRDLYFEMLFPSDVRARIYDASVEDFIDALNYKYSYTLPSTAALTALSTMVGTLKTNGIWQKIDAWWIYAFNNASLNGVQRINFRYPYLFRNTINGVMTYSVAGYKGSPTAWLDPAYIQSTNGNAFSVDDAARIAWVYTVHTSSNVYIDGRSVTSGDSFRESSTVSQRINQGATDLNSAVDLSGTGYTAIDADGVNTAKLFKGATKFTRTRTSSALPTTRQLIFKSGGNGGDMVLSMYILSGSLSDTQHGILNTAIQTYLTAIGL